MHTEHKQKSIKRNELVKQQLLVGKASGHCIVLLILRFLLPENRKNGYITFGAKIKIGKILGQLKSEIDEFRNGNLDNLKKRTACRRRTGRGRWRRTRNFLGNSLGLLPRIHLHIQAQTNVDRFAVALNIRIRNWSIENQFGSQFIPFGEGKWWFERWFRHQLPPIHSRRRLTSPPTTTTAAVSTNCLIPSVLYSNCFTL